MWCTAVTLLLLVSCGCRYALVALRLRPNFGMAHYQAAVCYEAMGLLREALTEAEKALEMAWWVNRVEGVWPTSLLQMLMRP